MIFPWLLVLGDVLLQESGVRWERPERTLDLQDAPRKQSIHDAWRLQFDIMANFTNSTNIRQNLKGSFSAVSKPNFARKISNTHLKALDEIYKIYTLAFAPLSIQNFSQKSSTFFANEKWIEFFRFFASNFAFFYEILMKCCRHFATNPRKCWYVSIFQLNWLKCFGNLPKFPENVKIIHYCSFLFIRALTCQ